MYPSCDTIYTGVMLNVEITRTTLFVCCVCFPSAVTRRCRNTLNDYCFVQDSHVQGLLAAGGFVFV